MGTATGKTAAMKLSSGAGHAPTRKTDYSKSYACSNDIRMFKFRIISF
jgi:hypothetical protein